MWVHNCLISGKAGVVDEKIASKWNSGTFDDITENLSYHFGKHGNGQTLEEYTDEASEFFQNNKSQAKWGQWNPKWAPSFRLKIGNFGGYFDAAGKILTYWN